MTRLPLLGALAAFLTAPCAAQQAASIDTWASTDADRTQVLRVGANIDWLNQDDERVRGFRLEEARFTPLGGHTTSFERGYIRYADKSATWAWNAQVGTDGHTVIGSASAHDNASWRKELFVERDILETPRGVTEGIYYTFAGGALDVPLGPRDSGTVVLGAQAFTGRNVRLHARANYVHLVEEDWGLTAQLRGRYFRSTVPGEYDYFSPRWYAEILPVVQLRRRAGGWRYLVAGGYGAQRDAGSGWRASRYLHGEASTPVSKAVQLKASFVYSNTPVGSGYVYDYLQGSFAVTRKF
jgi:hypothetical protein